MWPLSTVAGVANVARLAGAAAVAVSGTASRRSHSAAFEPRLEPPTSAKALSNRTYEQVMRSMPSENIRVGPPPTGSIAAPVPAAAAPAQEMRAIAPTPRRSTSTRALAGAVAVTVQKQPEELDDDADEIEGIGFFGEERRRVKVGERPSSARTARGSFSAATPAAHGGSQSARAAPSNERGKARRRSSS